MSPQSDVQKPKDDQFHLIQDSWPSESESSYAAAEVMADDTAALTSSQAESAMDAAAKTAEGMRGKTADSVGGGYDTAATQLHTQSQAYGTIAGWMTDAAGKVRTAKRQIAALVRSGTQEIRDALESETKGVPVTPSSNALTDKYRSDIAQVATTLSHDLDSIGHSLAGTPGSSRTPSYISIPTSPTVEHPSPTAQVVSYNSGQSPEVTPRQLPEMPRAVTAQNSESPSTPSTPASSAPHPTLANLVGGQGAPASSPSASSPGGTSTSSPHTPTSPSTQAHQPAEHHQDSKPAGAPLIPSIPLPNIPVAAETITTAVSSAAGHQLPAQAPTPSTPSIPGSTGFTPGTPPITPVAPGLAPIGGGGLSAPPVTQPATPAVQTTPAAPSPASQQGATPSPTRGPVVDAAWLQQRYGLAPGIEAPKPETALFPALFITELPEDAVHLHRVLATIRQEFESAGWNQPLAVATLKKGFEARCVYVTADSVSIHPLGVSLPHGVTPLDDMPTVPAYSEMAGSVMVTDKLASLIPRGWEVERLLSTVPADEQHQSTEQYRELVEAEELLPCAVSRGRVGVTAEVAMSVFAHAALGIGGCGELGVESARLKAARWIGIQPVGYGEALGRWYLADAAESMSAGRWGEAVYCSEKYLELGNTKKQVA